MKWFGVAKKSPRIQLAIAYLALSLALPLLVYAAIQQDQRQSANDPQIQLAHDAQVAPIKGPVIDISSSLAPFEIIYDEQHKVLGATGQLAGRTPVLPIGVFDNAKTHPDDRFTWEPQPGVRLATVIVYHPGGYVLAARNLREVEIRESHTQTYALATMSLLVIIGFIVIKFRNF